jgi:hypothetical protein
MHWLFVRKSRRTKDHWAAAAKSQTALPIWSVSLTLVRARGRERFWEFHPNGMAVYGAVLLAFARMRVRQLVDLAWQLKG